MANNLSEVVPFDPPRKRYAAYGLCRDGSWSYLSMSYDVEACRANGFLRAKRDPQLARPLVVRVVTYVAQAKTEDWFEDKDPATGSVVMRPHFGKLAKASSEVQHVKAK